MRGGVSGSTSSTIMMSEGVVAVAAIMSTGMEKVAAVADTTITIIMKMVRKTKPYNLVDCGRCGSPFYSL